MTTTESLKTTMQLIEHFELQGKLSNTNLTLELGKFQSNLSSSSGVLNF
jgi:hypothetical protein